MTLLFLFRHQFDGGVPVSDGFYYFLGRGICYSVFMPFAEILAYTVGFFRQDIVMKGDCRLGILEIF